MPVIIPVKCLRSMAKKGELLKLLELLADGRVHSGVELAEQLGVSRMTISNKVGAWIEKGLAIEVLPARGYQLKGRLELIQESKIRAGLEAQGKVGPLDVYVFDTVASTNDVASQLLAEGKSRIVCLAEHQQAGRGRRGRVWHALPGDSLCCTFGWRYQVGIQALQGLSLAVGVVLMDVFKEFGASGLGLKWPNDIVSYQGKVGGVLIEVSGEADGPCQLVVGIGLNIRNQPCLQEGVDQSVSSLANHCATLPGRNDLVVAIISKVSQLLDEFAATGFAPWQPRWKEYDFFANQQVVLSGGVTPVWGLNAGVDTHGALLMEEGGAITPYYGGELSLRRV